MERGGPTDNTRALLAKLASGTSRPASAPETRADPAPPRMASVHVRGGSLRARDVARGAALVVEGLRLQLLPGREI